MKANAPTAESVAIVSRYVSAKRGWKIDEYRIEERGRDGNLVVYLVINHEDEKNPLPGGGKSFEAYYDPQKREVVKELALQ